MGRRGLGSEQGRWRLGRAGRTGPLAVIQLASRRLVGSKPTWTNRDLTMLVDLYSQLDNRVLFVHTGRVVDLSALVTLPSTIGPEIEEPGGTDLLKPGSDRASLDKIPAPSGHLPVLDRPYLKLEALLTLVTDHQLETHLTPIAVGVSDRKVTARQQQAQRKERQQAAQESQLGPCPAGAPRVTLRPVALETPCSVMADPSISPCTLQRQ